MGQMRSLSRTGRTMFAGLGWCAVALAIVGAVVPGLPTTVFVLAASYCFSRSSPRFERWLRENPWLGRSLQRFASAGGMPRSAKRAALIVMWTAVLLSSAVLLHTHWGAAIGTIALAPSGRCRFVFGVRTTPQRAVARTVHSRDRWSALENSTLRGSS